MECNRWLAIIGAVTLVSLPLMAQQTGASSQQSGSARQVQPIHGELAVRLNTKSARVNEPVVLKITQKAQIPGGAVLPKSSRLLGHVTEVQARSKAHPGSRLGVVFDRAVLKNGQSFAIHSRIESVLPPQSMITEDEDAAANAFDNPGPSGPAFGGHRMTGTATAGSGLAGHGLAGDATLNANLNGGNMQPGIDTGIPGLMLSGGAAASGVLWDAKKNFRLDPGTQMVVDITVAGK